MRQAIASCFLLVMLTGCLAKATPTPDPMASFMPLVTGTQDCLTNRINNDKGFSSQVDAVQFDVVKTDSLVSPVRGMLSFTIHYGGSYGSAQGTFNVTYSYIKETWTFRDVSTQWGAPSDAAYFTEGMQQVIIGCIAK